jgi:lipopolysaccharide transport system permease protein
MLFWREFRTMYRRTAFGPLWAVAAPVAFIFVFIFFRLLFGIEATDGIPTIPFLFSGLANWMLFTTVLLGTFPALTRNVILLKKMPINPLVFVFSGALLPLVTYLVYFVVLEGMAAFYGYLPGVRHMLLPLLALIILLFSVGLGLLVAAIGLYKQDIILLLPVILQLGMFATPIFFPKSIVPEPLHWVIAINPMAHCIQMFRDIMFFAQWPDWLLLGKTTLVVAILWALALPLFKRTTRYLADMF